MYMGSQQRDRLGKDDLHHILSFSDYGRGRGVSYELEGKNKLS